MGIIIQNESYARVSHKQHYADYWLLSFEEAFKSGLVCV